MHWTATTILLTLLPMAGQQAAAENEPIMITLSCDGTVADTSSSPIPLDHQAKPIEKMGVVANLNERALSFSGFVAPISSVDAANVIFAGEDRVMVQGFKTRIDGVLDRVTGHMVADTMGYETNTPIDPKSILIRYHYDVLCKLTNRVF